MVDAMPERESDAKELKEKSLDHEASAAFDLEQRHSLMHMMERTVQDFERHLYNQRYPQRRRAQELQKSSGKSGETRIQIRDNLQNKDFISAQLEKYNINRNWLKKQTTSKVIEWNQEIQNKIAQEAKDLEGNILIENMDKLVDMMNTSVAGDEGLKNFFQR